MNKSVNINHFIDLIVKKIIIKEKINNHKEQ
jgi:hypothetical protein